MQTKKVQQVLAPPAPHMVGDGFRVHNFFPSGYNMGEQRMSPFFLLDYNSTIDFSAREHPRGIGVHPHRGFETVTIAYKGKVAHHDSAGNSGIVEEGGVQWMTAGAGILHKEYHEQEYSRKGGPFQMIQLWVNLPAKDKMTQPKYQDIKPTDMPVVPLPDNAGEVRVLAGSYESVTGPATTFSPIQMVNVHLKAGRKSSFSFPAQYNTGILMLEGAAIINGENTVALDHFALFANEGERFEIEATEEALFLIMSGEPLKEPIFAYGPFLMNSKAEVEQAYDDYNKGRFGFLE